MAEPVIKGTLHREFTFTRESANAEARTVELAFSSEAPVERWFGMEVLSHEAGACDLTRLNDGGPLLWMHDPDEQIGVIENARIDKDGIGRATVRFSRSEDGQEKFDDVMDGILRKVSVGYVIHQTETTKGQGDGPSSVRVTKWEPLEISLVSIPADNSVGVGRSAGDQANPPNPPKKMDTPTPTPPADGSTPENRGAPGTVTVQRDYAHEQREMSALAKRFNKQDLLIESLAAGETLAQFRAKVMDSLAPTPVAPATQTAPGTAGLSDRDIKEYSLVRAMRCIANKKPLDGLERDASLATAKSLRRDPEGFYIPTEVALRGLGGSLGGPELARASHGVRALNAGTFTAGGALIGTNVLYGSMIELLRNKTVVSALGATTLSDLQDNLAIPKITGGATAEWLAEGQDATGSQQSFGQLGLTPKRLCGMTAYTKQLLGQASVSVEALVRADLMRVLAIAFDLAAISGTGGVQPIGILNTTGINATVTYGGAAVWADLVEHETGIAVDNADTGTMGWLVSPSTRGKWKTILKDSVAGAGYLWPENNMPNGYRAEVTNQIAATSQSIFGVWIDLLLAYWMGMDVVVDPYSLAAGEKVRIIINMHGDVAVRQPLSFNVSTDSAAQ